MRRAPGQTTARIVWAKKFISDDRPRRYRGVRRRTRPVPHTAVRAWLAAVTAAVMAALATVGGW
jgi:hypothetical protein